MCYLSSSCHEAPANLLEASTGQLLFGSPEGVQLVQATAGTKGRLNRGPAASPSLETMSWCFSSADAGGLMSKHLDFHGFGSITMEILPQAAPPHCLGC